MTTPISNLDGARRAFCPRLNRHVGAPTRGGGDPHNSEAYLGDQSPQRAARGKDDGSHEIFPPCYVALEASLRRRYPGPHAVSLETSIHPLILFSVPSYNPFLSASTDVDDEENISHRSPNHRAVTQRVLVSVELTLSRRHLILSSSSASQ